MVIWELESFGVPGYSLQNSNTKPPGMDREVKEGPGPGP